RRTRRIERALSLAAGAAFVRPATALARRVAAAALTGAGAGSSGALAAALDIVAAPARIQNCAIHNRERQPHATVPVARTVPVGKCGEGREDLGQLVPMCGYGETLTS